MTACKKPMAPATCGVAMLVPERLDVDPLLYVDKILLPGAPKSIDSIPYPADAFWSFRVVLVTVIRKSLIHPVGTSPMLSTF